MKFKRLKFYITALLFSVALSSLFGAAVFAGAAAPEAPVPTSIVVPDTYEQYYEFTYPIDIDFSDDGSFIVIENDNDDVTHNKLTYFKDGVYTSFSFEDYSPTHATIFRNKVMFLSNSRIRLFDVETSTFSDTGMVASTSYSVFGNVVIANTSSGIDVYDVTETAAGFTFTYRDSLSLSSAPQALVMSSESQGYYFFNEFIYSLDLEDLSTVKLCQYGGTTRYSTYKDGFIYYTIKSGLFKCNVETREIAQVNMTTEYDGSGLDFYGDRLFVAYKDAKAVREIDLNAETTYNDNFTSYTITTEGNLPNRISKTPTDFTHAGGRLFIVDGNYLKIRKDDGGEFTRYSLAPFIGDGSEVTSVATDGKYIAIIESNPTGTVIKLLTEGDDALGIFGEIDEFTSVTDVAEYEGSFYFINNATKDSKQYAEIYRFTPGEDMTVEAVTSVLGTGWKIYLNVFGEIALSLQRNDKYYVCASATDEIPSEIAQKATDIFTDFDGNVYYVTAAGDRLYRFDGSATREFVFELWQNAPADSKMIGVELIDRNDQVYVLYNGFIMHNAEGLDVVTPNKLALPDDHAIGYEKDVTVATVREGAKLFEVSPLAEEGQVFFDYLGYRTKQGEGRFVLIEEFNKYALVADENGTFVIRSGDCTEKEALAIAAASGERFVTNDSNAYMLPILQEAFIAYKLKFNEKVTLDGTFSFNGIEFARVKKGDEFGYLPTAFLKIGIADAATPAHLLKSTVYRHGATLYYDRERTDEKMKLEYGTIVYVSEEFDDGTVKILYEDNYYYATSKELQTRTYYAVRNLIVIYLLLIGISATIIFILRRKVFYKKKDKKK